MDGPSQAPGQSLLEMGLSAPGQRLSCPGNEHPPSLPTPTRGRSHRGVGRCPPGTARPGLGTGCSAWRAKASGELTSCSPASARPWKSTADTAGSKPQMGQEVTLPEYLERVWEVVGREALKQILGTAEAQARNGAAGALEEDARLTASVPLDGPEHRRPLPAGDTSEVEETDEEDEAPQTVRVSGFSLPSDVARRFAQPLGIHLEDWEKPHHQHREGRGTAQAGHRPGQGTLRGVRNRRTGRRDRDQRHRIRPDEPVPRTGSNGQGDGHAGKDGWQHFPRGHGNSPGRRPPWTGSTPPCCSRHRAAPRPSAISCDAEQDRGPDFLRLANALSALYPRGCEEKRLLDGMLLAVPR